MSAAPSAPFPDDVYRRRLGETIKALETWAAAERDVANVALATTSAYWKLTVEPIIAGGCPFELMLRGDQRFNASIGPEAYEDRPVESFELFPRMVRAIASGKVERIEVRNALTGAIHSIEMLIRLDDGGSWIGQRHLAATPNAGDSVERRTFPFLPYRR